MQVIVGANTSSFHQPCAQHLGKHRATALHEGPHIVADFGEHYSLMYVHDISKVFAHVARLGAKLGGKIFVAFRAIGFHVTPGRAAQEGKARGRKLPCERRVEPSRSLSLSMRVAAVIA